MAGPRPGGGPAATVRPDVVIDLTTTTPENSPPPTAAAGGAARGPVNQYRDNTTPAPPTPPSPPSVGGGGFARSSVNDGKSALTAFDLKLFCIVCHCQLTFCQSCCIASPLAYFDSGDHEIAPNDDDSVAILPSPPPAPPINLNTPSTPMQMSPPQNQQGQAMEMTPEPPVAAPASAIAPAIAAEPAAAVVVRALEFDNNAPVMKGTPVRRSSRVHRPRKSRD